MAQLSMVNSGYAYLGIQREAIPLAPPRTSDVESSAWICTTMQST